MGGGNHSVLSEFVLLGLTSSWDMQILLFLFFAMCYVASVLGNLLTVLTIISDHRLHSPMYFFLANLSFIDTGVASIASPKMMYDLFRAYKVISLHGCLAQMFFIHMVGGTEMVLLVVMAYDRYVAICKPLHYLTTMSPRTCACLLALAWTVGLLHSVAQLAFVVNLPFCGTNTMDSFYCDFPRFIKLACTDSYSLEFLVAANSGFISTGTFFILMASYVFILVTVRKRASGGSPKALSTLSAHVTVVVLFFGPLIFFYTWPFPSSNLDKFLALFDAILTPFLNPVIYSLRNKEMKVAMWKLCYQLLGYRKMP
ncbi:PREDICTED: olfactory receptor 4F3/4F16/4F29-like [Dipodomys ordii]|uniref:Olfactory receptor n=1 Tax=Dipodomys ordii TaxID=10020 RepID=A0A1S3EZC9_DIPOR|nr:PREDICTED: olfactory receptor 4F3/4F16/4F29-like [Dipodomys ordii]